ncbi:hypothetical protein P3T76_000200 [Phytophthora citrophthora]|uniref:Uncharacterized protein n=1 Tax=Phytophthora citrophthora TaxID=4793 RepID=A0AAD9H0U1_9STRA|nr:hypothetical protein P3T76_000200 [Phytophthora citrophthora]
MSIATPVDVTIKVKENTPRTFTFRKVRTSRGSFAKQLPVTFKPEWASYWTEDRRVYPRPPPGEGTECPSCVNTLFLPITLLFKLIGYIIISPFLIINYIVNWIKSLVRSCRLGKSDPVVTRSQFYCWMGRNGFTNAEIKTAKQEIAKMQIQMYGIAHKLTDVRAVEEALKLQSIEKQKKVIGILQRSISAIDKRHDKQFERLRDKFIGGIFSWGAREAYKLGDVIAKNGRWFTRGEGDRKKADWEQKVAARVNLRVNAIVRCVNTLVNDGYFLHYDSRMNDIERTVNKNKGDRAPLHWNEFVTRNKLHHNRLLEEVHTAAPFIKQYITHAIVTESYCARIMRIMWAWSLLLIVVGIKLAKVILKLDISGFADVIAVIVGSVTDVIEAPAALLGMLESGLPTDTGGVGSDTGTGFSGSLEQVRLDNREARLDKHLDAFQDSTKHEEVNETPDS